MKIRHIIIIAIFLAINVTILLSLGFGKETPLEDKAEDIAFVPTLNATKIFNNEENFQITSYGTVSSFNTIDISSEVQGQLTQGKNGLKPGVKFRKGELLFKLDDTDSRYTLRSRKSSFINIIANLLPDLRIDFPNSYDKWNTYIQRIKLNENLPTLPAWSTSKEKIFLSTRNVLTEYFAIKSLEARLSKYSVYAPFNGVITDVFVTNLAVVNPGVRIIKIVETDNFEIPVSIPADQLSVINKGTEVSIFSTTNNTLKGAGTVIRISEVINKNTQSIDLFVKPKAVEGQQFIEGEYVRVAINQTGTHVGVRIPKNAVNDGDVYIYSMQDSTLKKQEVNIWDISEKGVFIKGLKDNQIVVTQEVLNYTDTSKYQVLIR